MQHIKADESLLNGTSLQGHAHTTYSKLVDTFGLPHSDGDGYKVDAEWVLLFSDGTVATIYNYKDGKNYEGENGLAVEDITDWHIGGNDWKAGQRVMSALGII